MFGADSTSSDIIGYICIYTWPVDCFPCLGLHLLSPQVGTLKVSKGPVEELWRDVDVIFLQENTGLDGPFIPGAPEVPDNPWALLEAIVPSPEC